MSLSEQLHSAAKEFILQQNPQGWTPEQLDMLTLEEILKHAAYYAR